MPSFPFELRPFQAEALRALERPAHVICVAPTGSGKSLIYETTAKRPGTRTLLISPLIALARQQHQRLLSAGVPTALAAGPDPGPPPPGRTGAWILSPERLLHPKTLETLRKWKPTFLVMDECHCLWDWGERFRPAFVQVPELLRSHSIERSLWLTATLPKPARQEISARLPQPVTEIGEFDLPPSLQLSVCSVSWADRPAKMIEYLSERPGAGVIFVNTRSMAQRLVQLISSTGRTCLLYHAGLGNEERRITEKKIQRRDPDVIVATSAFGMGMDHPHLNWALLWQAPPSLLSLAQAVGRVGRDLSTHSQAMVFWSEDDFRLLEWMIHDSSRQREELEQVHRFLSADQCRRSLLQNYFSSRTASSLCRQCDFCLALEELQTSTNSVLLY